MATAAPHVKLLRQLASAKDDYLSGAFDISWDGAKATLYLVFGRPSHAVFETDQEQIEGEAAIDALLAALPRVFTVSDWRRAMSPHETLSITIDELAAPFVRLAGSYADDPVTDEDPEWWSSVDDSPDLPFGLLDFPLLPGGRPLWVEASPDEVRLSERLAELPPSILILTGAKLRAAAVVTGGDLIDAVWIDSDDHARGETAGMALLGATKGSLAGYALDDPRVAEALTMLWRLPVAVSGVELAWLDPASMLAAFRADGLDRVLVIDAPVRGIALFSRGGLVAVYSETQRSAVASPERLRSLLSQARGRLTVMERKPRPLGAEASAKPASAHEFFEVAPQAGEPATASEGAEPGVTLAAMTAAEPQQFATSEAAVEATAADQTEVVLAAGSRDESDAPAETATTDETAAPAEPVPAWGFVTTVPSPHAEATADVSDTAQASEPDETTADAYAPPPPPSDDEVPAGASDTPPPPPPAPEAAQPALKSKRSRWGFGRSRKSRADRRAAEEVAAALADASNVSGDTEAATFAGWSVRQPNAEPQPPWLRSHEAVDAPSPDAEPEAGSDDAQALTWSVARRDDDVPAAVETPEPAGWAPADAVAGDAAPAAAGAETLAAQPLDAEAEAVPTHDLGSAAEPADAAPHEAGPAFDFISPDQPSSEPTPQAAHEPWLSSSWLDDVVDGGEAHGVAAPEAASAHDVTDEASEQPAQDAQAVEASTPEPEPEAAGDDVDHPEPSLETAPVTAELDQDHTAEPSPDTEAAAPDGEHAHPFETPRLAPVLRTPGPWSWPLAEPDEDSHAAGAMTTSPAGAEPLAPDPEPAGVAASPSDETEPAPNEKADSGFFHHDEPVGSQYVDFDEVRNELVQIGIVWLGEANAVQVTELLSGTRSTIDDFVATIDTIRGLHIEGQDPASIQAMSREMHQQAAERLCGA
jgi:hypothetical protein